MRLEPLSPDQLNNPIAGFMTLDEIVAQNAARNGGGPALFWPGKTPLTWGEVEAAVSALATAFSDWKLGDDATVGVQLGSSPQSAIACLALWRAGLVPAMLPLAWRRREVSIALASVGATAVLTMTRGAGVALGEIACEIAADLYSIRYIGCFGRETPDGATPLDDVLDRPTEPYLRPDRPDDAADHVAVVTFDAGRAPVARSHNELLAAALSPLVASRLSDKSSLVSTLDLAALGGLATGLVSWIASGCVATFLQPSDTVGFAATMRAAKASHLALPGRLAEALAHDCAFDPSALKAVTLVWRAPDGRGAQVDLGAGVTIVDASLFGELGIHAAARSVPARFSPLPLGTAGPDGFAPLIELRIRQDGRLAVRGPACPSAPCPADPGAPQIVFDDEGFLETGLAGLADRSAGRLSLGGRRRGVVQVGGLALSSADLDEAYRRSGAGALPRAQEDEIFGSRVALGTRTDGGEPNRDGVVSLLEAAGFGPALAPVETVVEPVRRTA